MFISERLYQKSFWNKDEISFLNPWNDISSLFQKDFLQYIRSSPGGGVTLWWGYIMVATRVRQSSSNELNTPVSNKVKCKQKFWNICIRYRADIESQAGPWDMSSAWRKVRRVSIPVGSVSRIERHWRVLWYYLPTPPLGQDMTQGQFLSGV